MVILAVDTNKLALHSLEQKLEKCYFTDKVVAFQNGKDAVLYAKSHAVDAIFTEVILEERSGLTLAEQIKKLHPSVSVNFVSTTKQYAMEAIQMHADSYLLKPVAEEELQKQRIPDRAKQQEYHAL